MNQTGSGITPQYLTVAGATPTVPYWIDALLPSDAGGYAALLGPNKTFNYCFVATAPAYFSADDRNGFKPFTDQQKAFVKQAFAYISSVIDVSFVENSDPTAPNTIALANNIQPQSAGYAYNPSSGPSGNDLLLAYDGTSIENLAPRDGTYPALVLIHELGHTLGLKHPFGHTDAGGVSGDGPFLSSAEDTSQFTVMSYNSRASEYHLQYSALDIAALQYLYGPSKAQQTNDVFKLSADGPNFIWDGGGVDTIDGSALTQPLTLSLQGGSWGYIGSKAALITSKGQIAINYGTTIENANGGSGADLITGNSSNNVINGGDGNDTIVSGGGNDTIDGGAGFDTVVMNAARGNFTVSKTGASVNLTGKTAANGSDLLSNVERVVFSDNVLAFDTDGNAGKAYRVYQAAFDRKPDLPGLGFWIKSMDDGGTLLNVSSGFVNSDEFRSLYGVNPSSDTFLTRLYSNVLHRAPDQSGYNFWKANLDSGALTSKQILIDFSESPENQAQVIGSIQNGIEFMPYSG